MPSQLPPPPQGVRGCAELDEGFAPTSGELKRVFVMLEKAFKLSRAEA